MGAGQVLTFCRAAAALDPSDAEDVYCAGRACLVSRHEDLEAYDRVFRRWFGLGRPSVVSVVGQLPKVAAVPLEGVGVPLPSALRAEAPRGTTASSAEVLRHKRFAHCSPDELAELHRLIARLRLRPPVRRTRRTAPARRGPTSDLRRTVRRAMRTHGEVVHHAWRDRRVRPRRLVLLLDVSGSMAASSRALLQFSHSAASTTRAPTEVFCFGTRLTRVTRQLRERRPDDALADAAEAVVDWEGGTRIGESLRTFTRAWGRRGLARGAVVVICSDGLERGDPAVLEREMARLSRLAHRVVWVNPLKGDPRYRPEARGMRAALPYVDDFVAGHDLASLESLAALLPSVT